MTKFFSLQPHEKERVIKFFKKRRKKGNDDECWEWKARIEPNGYGRVCIDTSVNGKRKQLFLEYAHRLAWVLFYNTPIPKGLFCCHSCDNRKCVNPKHIFLATQQQNTRDAVQKDRFCAIPLLERFKVVDALIAGFSYSEVGKMFKISVPTVHVYVNRKETIARYGKLDFSSRNGSTRRRDLWKNPVTAAPNPLYGTPRHQPT